MPFGHSTAAAPQSPSPSPFANSSSSTQPPGPPPPPPQQLKLAKVLIANRTKRTELARAWVSEALVACARSPRDFLFPTLGPAPSNGLGTVFRHCSSSWRVRFFVCACWGCAGGGCGNASLTLRSYHSTPAFGCRLSGRACARGRLIITHSVALRVLFVVQDVFNEREREKLKRNETKGGPASKMRERRAQDFFLRRCGRFLLFAV